MHSGKHKKMLEGHSKGVRSLAYSPDYRFLVSAGFDYDALVWNPYVEHLILRLHGTYQNETRVFCIVVCCWEHLHTIWALFLAISSPWMSLCSPDFSSLIGFVVCMQILHANIILYNIQTGHTSSLCGVQIIPNTPQIITADTEGVFKVWNIRNFSCMQTFTGENVTTLRDFVSVTPHKRLVATARV